MSESKKNNSLTEEQKLEFEEIAREMGYEYGVQDAASIEFVILYVEGYPNIGSTIHYDVAGEYGNAPYEANPSLNARVLIEDGVGFDKFYAPYPTGGSGSDHKVIVTSADTNPDYLGAKVDGITLGHSNDTIFVQDDILWKNIDVTGYISIGQWMFTLPGNLTESFGLRSRIILSNQTQTVNGVIRYVNYVADSDTTVIIISSDSDLPSSVNTILTNRITPDQLPLSKSLNVTASYSLTIDDMLNTPCISLDADNFGQVLTIDTNDLPVPSGTKLWISNLSASIPFTISAGAINLSDAPVVLGPFDSIQMFMSPEDSSYSDCWLATIYRNAPPAVIQCTSSYVIPSSGVNRTYEMFSPTNGSFTPPSPTLCPNGSWLKFVNAGSSLLTIVGHVAWYENQFPVLLPFHEMSIVNDGSHWQGQAPLSKTIVKTSDYTLTVNDANRALSINASIDSSFTLLNPSQLTSSVYQQFINAGTANLTIIGTVSGIVNPTVAPNSTMTIFTDGTSWFQIGGGPVTTNQIVNNETDTAYTFTANDVNQTWIFQTDGTTATVDDAVTYPTGSQLRIISINTLIMVGTINGETEHALTANQEVVLTYDGSAWHGDFSQDISGWNFISTPGLIYVPDPVYNILTMPGDLTGLPVRGCKFKFHLLSQGDIIGTITDLEYDSGNDLTQIYVSCENGQLDDSIFTVYQSIIPTVENNLPTIQPSRIQSDYICTLSDLNGTIIAEEGCASITILATDWNIANGATQDIICASLNPVTIVGTIYGYTENIVLNQYDILHLTKVWIDTNVWIADITGKNVIHVDVANEFANVPVKSAPVLGDYIIIEDSEDSMKKKKISVTNAFACPEWYMIPGAQTGDMTLTADQLGNFYYLSLQSACNVYLPNISTSPRFDGKGYRFQIIAKGDPSYTMVIHPYSGQLINGSSSPYIIYGTNEMIEVTAVLFGNHSNCNWSITSSGDMAGKPTTTTPLVFADNASAIAGGLSEGDIYRTGDLLKVVHTLS